MPHDEQIVRDKQVRNAQLFLQLLEHIDDLRLDRYIQRTYRLITDDEARVRRQGSRDPDTLSLSAGEFMRVTCRVLRVQTHQRHQLKHARSAFFLCLI